MSNADGLRAAPARDYDDAVQRFGALAERDGPNISSAGRSRFFGHGKRTRRACVFIHGFTNCPQQWTLFASEVHAAGATIVIPRLPGHGHFDRATRAAAKPSAADVFETVNRAVDIAAGPAEETVLVGLSIGGTIGPRIALARDDIARTVALVPFFAVKGFDEARTRRLAAVLTCLPNASVPWDPFGDGAQIPSYGYPKFSTRMLGRFLQIGDGVVPAATARSPRGRLTFVLNANEPACDNGVTRRVADALLQAGPGATDLIVWDDLPANHDIIDPTNPKARIDLVYPRLRALIDA